MPHIESKFQRNPRLAPVERGTESSLDDAVVTLVERQTRLLQLRRRAIRAADPGLADARSRIPDDAA
jgi:hypothetical protein